jgi:hypothetical protein
MMKRRSNWLLVLVVFVSIRSAMGQAVPAPEENIPFLVTFGRQAETSWGDDDFSQVFFFVIPKDQKQPVYLRVFDPDCGGMHDEGKGEFNTKTRFSVFGGDGCITHPDARQSDPVGNWKSGNLLATKTFGVDAKYDNKWYSFGPFNPGEGELAEAYGGYVFKLIAEGVSGDDGNLYRYFMSTDSDKNIPVQGGNAFTFEYTFRLHADPWETSHIYPYVDDKVISLKLHNFDWDDDGYIKLHSVATMAHNLEISGDNRWAMAVYKVLNEERGTSIDVRFTKSDKQMVRNNNVVFYITNQYGEFLPFYTVPIGGVPVYKGKVKATPLE